MTEPSTAGIAANGRINIQRGLLESIVVPVNQCCALLIEDVQLRQLRQTYRRPDIVEAEIESDFQHVILSGRPFSRSQLEAVIPCDRSNRSRRARSSSPVVIIPPSAVVMFLVTEETETSRNAEASTRLLPEQGSGRVSRIFDHANPVRRCEGASRSMFAGMRRSVRVTSPSSAG
jgi:hypothetical protein